MGPIPADRPRIKLAGHPDPYAEAPAPLSAKDQLVASLREQVAWLQAELRRQAEASELREAETRAQLVALANASALAMSSYYGPARPRSSGETFEGRGVMRVVPPGMPTPTPPDDDGPAASRPWDNSLFTEEHIDLGADFRVDVPATTAPEGSSEEEALVEATIERAAKEREAARLGTAAPQRGAEED